MAAQVFWAVFIPVNGRAKSAQQLISTVLPFHPLYFPWLQVLLEMSTVCRFSFLIVKEFLHKCQPWVGRWSILGTIWSTQLKNDPLAWSRGKSSHHEIHFSLALNQLPRGARPTFTICVLCCKKYITHEQNVFKHFVKTIQSRADLMFFKTSQVLRVLKFALLKLSSL